MFLKSIIYIRIDLRSEVIMKYFSAYLALVLFAGVYKLNANTQVWQYGSNPMLSYDLFPQDIGELPVNMLSWSPSYKKSPFWGDIDEPLKKPNANYTSTGINTIFTDAHFKHTANVYSVGNYFTYSHLLPSGNVLLLSTNYDVDNRYNHADGSLNASGIPNIPFDYTMYHVINKFLLQGGINFKLFGIPAGIELKSGVDNSLLLNSKINFTKNGVNYNSERALWGWSTAGCTHIFIDKGLQGDAWFQQGYGKGPIFIFDINTGINLPFGKMGTSFTWQGGNQEFYTWQTSVTDTSDKLGQNYIGNYVKSDWQKKSNKGDVTMYGNFPYKRIGDNQVNIFGKVDYSWSTVNPVLGNNNEVAGGNKDKIKSIALEAAPNLLIPLGSIFNYIDVGLSTEYAYSRFDNTTLHWVNGGQIEVHQSSPVPTEDENDWEWFSYANRNSFSLGLDASTMFPLFKNQEFQLGLGLLMLIDTRYTFFTKYYGGVPNGSTKFNISNRREDFERENRFSTGVKLQYNRKPYLAWIEVTEPLLHSLLPRTRITDASGKNEIYEHTKMPLWLSQEGLKVSVYVSKEWTMPFLR